MAAALLASACDLAGLGPPTTHRNGSAAPNPNVVPPPQVGVDAPFDASASRSDPRVARDGGQAPRDAGPPPPPEPYEPNEELAAEHVLAGEQPGVVLWARWDWHLAAPPVAASDGKQLAGPQQTAARTQRVELATGGRMRFVFASRGLPLPLDSALLARTDRLGALLFWPDPSRYRVLPPGTLRAVFDDRRVDATWLTKARGHDVGTGSRLGLSTRRTQLDGAHGRVDLELGQVVEAGAGASLLCRLLVELAGIHPGTPSCRSPGEVVLVATYRWPTGTELGFEVVQLERRLDLPAQRFAMPPPDARMASGGLPGALNEQVVAPAQMAAMPAGPAGPSPAGAGAETVAINHSDRLLWLMLGHVAVGYVAPSHRIQLVGVAPGAHVAQWRSFLGELIGPPSNVESPGSIAFGTPPSASADVPEGG